MSIYHRAHSNERNVGNIEITYPDGRREIPIFLSGNAFLEKTREILHIAGKLTSSNKDVYVEILNKHDGEIEKLPEL